MSTTTRLLDAAEYRMRRGGYNAVSFRDLAADTAIKSSSVHYHYPKKEDLVIALIGRYRERFFSALSAMGAGATTPREKIEVFRKVYRAALVNDEANCLCGLLGAEMDGLPKIVGERVQDFFQENIDWVAAALSTSLSDAERHQNSVAIVAAFQGSILLANGMAQPELFDTITNGVIAAFVP